MVVDSHTPRTAAVGLSCFRATPPGKRRQAGGKRPNHGRCSVKVDCKTTIQHAAAFAFALIALLLAAVGIYSVMAYSVTQRTHEIGVRMALGADRANVRNMVLREGLLRGVVGMVCGMCAAFFLVRLLAGMLYGVSIWDPTVFLAVPAFLVLLTAIAAWIPARRAARLDPVQALRFE